MNKKIAAYAIVLFIVLASCSSNKVYNVFSNEEILIKVGFKYQDSKTNHIFCELKATNLTNDTIKYYNSAVRMIAHSDSLIALHDSYASWAYPLTIPPKESLSLDIYFESKTIINENSYQNMLLKYDTSVLPFIN